LPEGKPQHDTSSLVAQPSTPPAPSVTQPQVVFVKQFQQPKPYTRASSWKCYREYFERLAAVNGWATPEQRAGQLALALEGPATEVLRGLDISQPQAYNAIWEALARRFGRLMALERPCAALIRGARKTMKQSRTSNRPYVLCIGRLGLRPPLNRGMRYLSDALKTFSQPQDQRGTDGRPRTPPTFQRDRRQFQPCPATLPGPIRQPRRGCFVCGAFGCHTVIHERNGTLPPNFRRAPTSGTNDRPRGNSNNNSCLNANARVFTPSPNGQRRAPSGNSGGNPGSGNRVPPLQRPSSA